MHIISYAQEDNEGMMCLLLKYKDFYKLSISQEHKNSITNSNHNKYVIISLRPNFERKGVFSQDTLFINNNMSLDFHMKATDSEKRIPVFIQVSNTNF